MQSQPLGVFWYADWTDPLPPYHVLLERRPQPLATAESCRYLLGAGPCPTPEQWCGSSRPAENSLAGQPSHTALQVAPHSRRAAVTVLDHNNNNNSTSGSGPQQVPVSRDDSCSLANSRSRPS